jgi:hypothetical protein
LRIKKDGQVYYPWVLDPQNPFAPSLTGDNTLDNVEQILIENPETGTYIIEVSHKGSLQNNGTLTDGSQVFSIVTTGESYCSDGAIIYNNDTNSFNFCKDGYWIEK